MQRLKLEKNNSAKLIEQAVAILKNGGLMIYPTETCYGIGADATNQAAIKKLLDYKTKRNDKPISVAVSDKKMAARYVHINKTADNIYDNFLPGPITVVSKSKHILAPGVESSMGTQGIRIPDHHFILELLKIYKKPITATSANASYKKTPYTIADVLNNISAKQKKLIGIIIDAGRLPKRKPSTVVDTTLDNIHVVREGSIVLKNEIVFVANSLNDTQKLVGTIFEKVKKYVGKKPVVFLLQGELGAGKTHFTKYLAKKLLIKDVVVSPTFTICREYVGKMARKKITLQHLDTYRLYEPSEIEELHPKKIFHKDNIVVIEWANKIIDYVQQYLKEAIVVKIKIEATAENVRRFEYEIDK